MAKQYFVTATHTDAGKTFISTLLCLALKANYWKPIQTGADPITGEGSDRLWVDRYISQLSLCAYPEAYTFSLPQSPNIAASAVGQSIDLSRIVLPNTQKDLIIEGAGGILVPINRDAVMLDMIQILGVEVILIVPSYLGTINHTLLTCKVLRESNINIAGVVFNGNFETGVIDTIREFSDLPVLGCVPRLETIDLTQLLSISSSLNIKLLR